MSKSKDVESSADVFDTDVTAPFVACFLDRDTFSLALSMFTSIEIFKIGTLCQHSPLQHVALGAATVNTKAT